MALKHNGGVALAVVASEVKGGVAVRDVDCNAIGAVAVVVTTAGRPGDGNCVASGWRRPRPSVGLEAVGPAVSRLVGAEVAGVPEGAAVGSAVGMAVGVAVAKHEPVNGSTIAWTDWFIGMPLSAQSAS